MESALDDIEFLARSPSRVTALEMLAEHPRSRDELQMLTGASPSTVGRMLRAFEERHWIRRDGHQYTATSLGAFVATQFEDLTEQIEAERTLREVWQWLPSEDDGFTIEMGADATITIADINDPYQPVNRFVSLLRETDQFRFVGFDVALLEPCRDDLAERILGGMEAEIIDPPSIANYILTTYPKHCADPLASGNLTVWLHDDLPPYGISLFDDRIGISGYNQESGTVHVFLDTDHPMAREWAQSIYEEYLRDARPLALDSETKYA
ncbi:helix-turn-helix transcriptional regulator [Saliphagus infecundisoli]|uniref:Helix-turn-helix transcriptional regulator n=1 Tax=Saliphagus infecundisoli TaxID=1849069 RepID=A0ABD5QK42_9EURY|nr:helix-turn-helix domain-containing protein [Saliphagus infecundisoli]